MAEAVAKYKNWTRNALLERLQLLEDEFKRRRIDIDAELAGATRHATEAGEKAQPGASQKIKKKKGDIDPSRYSTRLIALKLAYLGKNYAGFEFQTASHANTIEEELWNALTTARLIYPRDRNEVDFGCCEYAKCGRTDRGVSAFGQVISLRVRSNRPLLRTKSDDEVAGRNGGSGDEEGVTEEPFDDVKDEIHYVNKLNGLLPPDIRILAWCPSPPPNFNARFSCRERRYRYFFTQPAFPPLHARYNPTGCNGWLDIEKMREAAKMFEGVHDFRNFCKVDPAKQVTNYQRRIYHADIVEVEDAESALPYLNVWDPDGREPRLDALSGRLPKVYSFDVWGTAFLWHQIRCMVSILFLIGQGLESPELVRTMLDVEKMPRRTAYVMASDVPLVLWDCLFPEEDDPEGKDALRWVYPSEESPADALSATALRDCMWEAWRERKMDEILASQLFRYVNRLDLPGSGPGLAEGAGLKPARPRIFEGGNTAKLSGKYVPVEKLGKLASPEEQNDTYARKKGFANAEEMRSTESWRKAIKDAKASAGDTQAGEDNSTLLGNRGTCGSK